MLVGVVAANATMPLLPRPAFTPGHMLPDTSCIHFYPLVALDILYLVSATKLSPVCRPSVAGYKGIQVDRDK